MNDRVYSPTYANSCFGLTSKEPIALSKQHYRSRRLNAFNFAQIDNYANT